ncbi:MAG: serine/threonine-protein phosphatase [Deltaproteobacteria bacterium]|jgi:serine phosphatase RsbU (regulator of sigma subunit)|nr:serine/threonine-protein phosphatase [Deltaproteobacteria bacterium]
MDESGQKRSRLPRPVDPYEVKLAGEVQKLLLPKSSPLSSWCRMSARNRMADVLGGDFYDFIKLEDSCQVLLLGDVTGHGLHASVVMSLMYGFIHRAARQSCSPDAVVTDLNTFLRSFAKRSDLLDHYFSATLFFGVVDPRTLTMHYVNAGHPAGLVRRGDEILRLPATSHPVGYFDREHFQVGTFQFTAADRFLLYTDGLVDSPNQQGEMFGAERLDDAFRRLNGGHMVFLDRLFAEIDTFLAGQAPFDDCTAIVMDLHRAT